MNAQLSRLVLRVAHCQQLKELVQVARKAHLATLDGELVVIVEDAACCKVRQVKSLLHGHISQVQDTDHVASNALDLQSTL
jgi:hypothetical protein